MSDHSSPPFFIPGIVEVRSRSNTHSPSSSRPGSSSRHYSPFTNYTGPHLHENSFLIQGIAGPTWHQYLASVDGVAKTLLPSPNLAEWRRSVVEPFESNWSTLAGHHRKAIRDVLERIRSLYLDGYPPRRSVALFEGWVPPLEQLIYGVPVYLADVRDDESLSAAEGEESFPWFQLAVAHHIIMKAAYFEPKGGDLRECLKEATNALIRDFPSEGRQVKEIRDYLNLHWGALVEGGRAEFAISIIEKTYHLLELVRESEQVEDHLLYLWIPPLDRVLNALGIDHQITPSVTPSIMSSASLSSSSSAVHSPSHSPAHSHSIGCRRNLLSRRKRDFYFS